MSVWNRIRGYFTGAAKSIGHVVVGLRGALQGLAPGAWASDHRAESEKFTGWTYIAIHALATQCASAEVSCFNDSTDPAGRKSRRKSLRAMHGSLGRHKSLYGGDDRETEPLPQDHPLVKLMRRPNPTTSGATFRYQRAMQLRLTGSAMVWNVPNRAGVTVERYLIPTAIASPVQPSKELPRGGWRIQPSASRFTVIGDGSDGFVETYGLLAFIGKVIPTEQVQITRLPHPTLLDDGQSPIAAGALWTEAGEMVDATRYHQLRNGADPSLLWTLPQHVDPDESEADRITKKINSKYAGAENTGKVILAQFGTTVTPLSTTPKDMAYDRGFLDYRNATLALHNTPPVAVGLQEPGAYAAYFASLRAYRSVAVQPVLDMFAEDDTETIAKQFGPGMVIEMEAEPIEDPEQTERELQTDIAARAITVNELRAVRGRPPLPGPEGDELVGRSELATAGMMPGMSGGSGSSGSPFERIQKPPASFGGGGGAGASGQSDQQPSNGSDSPVGKSLPPHLHSHYANVSPALLAALGVAEQSAVSDREHAALKRHAASLGSGTNGQHSTNGSHA
jgi:phage portal protein BeeE